MIDTDERQSMLRTCLSHIQHSIKARGYRERRYWNTLYDRYSELSP